MPHLGSAQQNVVKPLQPRCDEGQTLWDIEGFVFRYERMRKKDTEEETGEGEENTSSNRKSAGEQGDRARDLVD